MTGAEVRESWSDRILPEGGGQSNAPSEIAALDVYIPLRHDVLTSEARLMAVKMTSIRLDTDLADEAAKILGVKSRTEAVHVALREIVALKRFKDLMRKHRGKLSFAGS
jgi:Arc/MetJ family transcription regulator